MRVDDDSSRRFRLAPSASRGARSRRANSGVSNSAGIGSSPVIQASISGIGHVEQALELVEFGLAHRGQIGVGELAHHEVHLAQAPPPGAKQNAPPARVEPGAGEGGAGHGNLFRVVNPARPKPAIAALDPVIHVIALRRPAKESRDVDGRAKPGHEGFGLRIAGL